MARTRANGEGTIYRRSDGRWGASIFVDTTSGKRKRIHMYGKTRQEVHDRLTAKLAEIRKGVRTPDREWTVGAYLDYWLANVVAVKDRPRTVELYEGFIRLYLKPAFGSVRLSKLTIQHVQTFLNDRLATGSSVRSVHQMRSTLRAALSRAEREELVHRNVAKLVELPAWERRSIQPWTADEGRRFLAAARSHRLYPAFAMLLLYGLRRGEVLGLRWCDIDFSRNQIHVRQQLQRIGKVLQQGPVKTAAGRRDLPLLALVRDELAMLYEHRHGHAPAGALSEHDTSGQELVFLSSVGTPMDPKNFVRSFDEIARQAQVPTITVHHARHTTATLLKNLGVPARDTQLILGHSHVTTTQQLYQHADLEGRLAALTKVEQQLLAVPTAAKSAANDEFSTGEGTILHAFTPGGPGGARTLDTLLKSYMLLAGSTPSTPVIKHIRTRAYTCILGRAAVKKCCKTGSHTTPSETDEADLVAILHAIDRLQVHNLKQRSFPLNLLPPATFPIVSTSPAAEHHTERRAA